MSPPKTSIPQVDTASVTIQGVDIVQAVTDDTSVSTPALSESDSCLTGEITLLKSTNQTLSRQNSFLSEEISKMQLEMADIKTALKRREENMLEHIEELKALIPAAVKRRKTESKFRPSADLLKKTDTSIKSSLEELALNNTTWDFQYGFKRGTNKSIYADVMGKVMGVLVMEGMTVADQGDYQRLMNKKLQDKFSNEKLITGSTEEELNALKRRKRLNNRINTKYANRKAIFNKMKGKKLFEEHFGTEEECAIFLDKELMSDDEDGETIAINGDVFAVSFRRLIPSWRSDKLNAFFRYLDHLYNKNPSTKKRNFVEEIVEKELDNTIRVLKKIPQWGIRMETVEEVSGDSLEL